MEDQLIIVGIDAIAAAISPDFGRQRVMTLIKLGLPAYQLNQNGPWMVSYDAMRDWIRDFCPAPTRV